LPNQIVPLSSSINPADSSFSYSGVFWLTVPTANVVPRPSFASAVPFIDQVTLAALRAGTLQEQSFTSGYYPSGTTAAAVQSSSSTPPSLQSLFTTAQSALTAAASPVTGIIGNEYTGSAWVAVSASAIFDPNSKLVADVSWAAAAGLVPGITSGRATGYVATSAATLKAVMATPYTPQITNAQRSLVSTSTNDAAAGTGATQVTITYLDAGFAVHTEVVTLNGTTAVNTVGTNYAYIESMVVTQCGSTGSNQGTISIMTGTAGAGTAWGSIAVSSGVGNNQTFWAHHYVPAGVTCYVLSFEGASSGVLQTVILGRTGNPSATNLPLIQIGPTMVTTSGDYREHDFTCALAIPGPDRIVFSAQPFAGTASTSFGNFEFIQF
jgi:hypothetical protein